MNLRKTRPRWGQVAALLALTGVGGTGCSAANYDAREQAYGEADEESSQMHLDSAPVTSTASRSTWNPGANAAAPMPPAPMPTAMAMERQSVKASADRSYSLQSSSVGGVATKSGGGSVTYAPQQIPQGQQQAPLPHDAKERKAAPAVIYQGYMRLRVRRILDAIEQATKVAGESGGYVQMQSAQTLILRMPATDFEAAMQKFSELGIVLQRTVQAVDVSRQVTDLDARLAVATQARARLLELLKTVKDVEERLQVLEEIKRLTETMETMQSSLATLRNLTSYFTITIDFESLAASGAAPSHASPFEWVRNLRAHLVTLESGHNQVSLTLPFGFVLFEKTRVLRGGGVWRAQASDTSMLRASKVDNDPKGDALFWAKAVAFELDGRDEQLVESSRQGQLEVRVYKNKDARPRWWLVATTTAGDDAWVVEAFFPTEAAWKLRGKGVIDALKTFEVK